MSPEPVREMLIRSPKLRQRLLVQEKNVDPSLNGLPTEFAFLGRQKTPWELLGKQQVEKTRAGLYVAFVDRYVLYVGRSSPKGTSGMEYTITKRHARAKPSGVFRNPFRVKLWFDVVQFTLEKHASHDDAARAVLDFLHLTTWCWGYHDVAGLDRRECDLMKLLSPLLNDYKERA